ncbi:RNA-binding S4 domain-containing protein [Roseitalea porphyridii]|uniref:RNA-binding S4 domain-containing protein n=1 Tax=Roseitalea porphyridii TaxID=1852022 RepID=A0A4P6UVL4_9HYPH|nr:RNA-binding S4 domain-containing protein [Roseitalea porphyridii]QBK29181.1 RNA-binding S4 domain-containing protein [Roseitalea porphyridii]
MSEAGQAEPRLPAPGPDRQRVDRWLFFARVVKSRALAAKMVGSGAVRVNSDKITQPSRSVRPDDVLTINTGRRVLVYRVVDCGTRRGPAREARLLYEDLSPPPPERPASPLDAPALRREPGTGRPTKKERRALDKLDPNGNSW